MYIRPGTPFQMNATMAYPQPPPSALSTHPASSCNTTITLPANPSLAHGEVQKKTVGTGLLEAGVNSTISWMLVANSSVRGVITIEVEGGISGSVGAHGNYTAYDYSDRIGAAANFTMELAEDDNFPLIGVPFRVPESDVQPNQEVEVSVSVTDAESGVKAVTLFYTITNGTTWENRIMSYNLSASLYEGTIPGQEAGTSVRFEIAACDYVGNNATRDGTQPYCTYEVVPEFPSSLFLPPLMVLATSIIICTKKRILRKMKT